MAESATILIHRRDRRRGWRPHRDLTGRAPGELVVDGGFAQAWKNTRRIGSPLLACELSTLAGMPRE